MIISTPVSLVVLCLLYWFGWTEHVEFALKQIILFIIIMVVIYILIFLWFMLKPPAPKRGDVNFLISYKDAEVIPAARDSLPIANHGMRWVRVPLNLEINYVTKINSLVLSLRGKCYEAYEWKPIGTNKISGYPRWHHFQVPDYVDLTKHRAEVIALTDEEDYASVKFHIKQ